MVGGFFKTFGLFIGKEQIGFICFAEYTPWRDKKKPRKMHSNRVVIHPDYCGIGLGIKLNDITADFMKNEGYDVRIKFSSLPLYKALKNRDRWKLISKQMTTPDGGTAIGKRSSLRKKVKTWSFKYIG